MRCSRPPRAPRASTRSSAERQTSPRAGTVLSLLVTTTVSAFTLVLPAGSASAAETYSAPYSTAVAGLTVRTESRTRYARSLFEHWVDADGDGCETRKEVLVAEADDPVTVGAGCALSGGRWFSYYDEKSALPSRASGCADSTITVTRAI